jgi:hypothetical protein
MHRIARGPYRFTAVGTIDAISCAESTANSTYCAELQKTIGDTAPIFNWDVNAFFIIIELMLTLLKRKKD